MNLCTDNQVTVHEAASETVSGEEETTNLLPGATKEDWQSRKE